MSCWEHGKNAIQKPRKPGDKKVNWKDKPQSVDELLKKKKGK